MSEHASAKVQQHQISEQFHKVYDKEIYCKLQEDTLKSIATNIDHSI